MGKSPSKSAIENPEFYPDAWERFERAAAAVTKSPPQHRVAKKKKAVKKAKKKPGQ